MATWLQKDSEDARGFRTNGKSKLGLQNNGIYGLIAFTREAFGLLFRKSVDFSMEQRRAEKYSADVKPHDFKKSSNVTWHISLAGS